MTKEVITERQGIGLVAMLIIGTSAIYTLAFEAGRDLWIANILSIGMAFIIGLICAKINRIFPGKDLYEILEICFGNVIGKIISILYTWYFIHDAAEIARNYSTFVTTVSIPETPFIIIVMFLVLLCTFVIRDGIETLSKVNEVFIIVFIFFVLIGAILLLPKIHPENIKPVLYNGMRPVLKGAFSAFSFPFGELVIFITVFSHLRNVDSSTKIYSFGLLLGGIILIIISIFDLLVLGVSNALVELYPSYSTFAKIDIGNFLQRLEIISAIFFSLGTFIKLSIYLLVACRGITGIFKLSEYRSIVTVVALNIVNLSYAMYDGTLEYFEWSHEIWPYYSALFQIVLVIILLSVSFIKGKNKNLVRRSI
ncbi:GerAB/ArcD/ProY family transporter [Brassicibacter mesophilus]|uniref:GerAB/ArcD/ProY family transporter n=1 Tax=Brassicibacter mesophilus TaxID=745119 RepID=UPI003D1B66E0